MVTRTYVAALVLPLLLTQAVAQGMPAASSPPAAPSVQSSQPKREACLALIATKGGREPERADEIEICMAEGRLNCIKQAVAKKVPRADRKKYLQTCMGTQPTK